MKFTTTALLVFCCVFISGCSGDTSNSMTPNTSLSALFEAEKNHLVFTGELSGGSS